MTAFITAYNASTPKVWQQAIPRGTGSKAAYVRQFGRRAKSLILEIMKTILNRGTRVASLLVLGAVLCVSVAPLDAFPPARAVDYAEPARLVGNILSLAPQPGKLLFR